MSDAPTPITLGHEITLGVKHGQIQRWECSCGAMLERERDFLRAELRRLARIYPGQVAIDARRALRVSREVADGRRDAHGRKVQPC